MDSVAAMWGIMYFLMGFVAVLQAKVTSSILTKSRDQGHADTYTECLFLGKLDISVHLTMNSSHDDKFTKYSTTLHTPGGGLIPANCSSGRAGVILLSDDRQVGISIVFEEQNETDTDAHPWAITKLAVVTKDDVSDDVDNDALSKRGFERNPGLLMFQTPFNRTIVCDANQKVVFHSDRAHASIVFSHIKMKPHPGRGQWNKQKGFVCPEPIQHDTAQARNVQIFVPVILSISLAVVVSLLVIGYLIHRKIEGMGYTTME